MKIFVAVVAFLMSQITAVSAKTVTYSCTDANVLTLTIGDRTSSDQDTTAYFASSLETDTECIQTLTAGATTDVTFMITLSTTDPAKCGMVFDNNTSVFTGTLWIKKALTIVQNGDSYSNLQIRCEGAARDVDATVTAITDTSSPILPSEAQSNENVAITVELADGSAISGAVTMAQQIRLRVALTMQSAPVARAVRVSDCTVKPTSSSDASVKLITDYCGDSSTGVLATSQGFTGAASADGTTQESISASFPPFLIAGHESTNSMFITCRCVFCGTAGDTKCEGVSWRRS
ncbi:uncharacterized protein LOC106160047 [Lingula anatina]|uniref:Uncharacterized protein LOC106160047 n=1 Tax=Lingula anatina TaxID=7574 RepID=A0A1S3I176_LINAN|nr:uncharacterized protein LOC106160047 [Lingula anatina]|eukprot:XP_013392015.1 uncharacterized protein LOC106160047 [Lingula anatina]